ncbi:MAG: hypothetical protein ABJ208_15965 [Rhodopirellula bahusiensis]|uniref:hypothetical protein n=2 Tax=Rhodopirellula bahusiensis TaxID=2014065 RepID=UPI00329A6560
MAVMSAMAVLGSLLSTGCMKKTDTVHRPVFEERSLDACLVLSIDLSSSFAADFGERAYPMVLGLVQSFTDQSLGGDCKIVLSQMSGHDQVVLFEGSPGELRHRFGSPEAMAAFLLENSKPNASPVYVATRKTIDYVNAMPDVTEQTRTVTVLLSDLVDSEQHQPTKSREGFRMLDALTRYRESGGNLALYYVAQNEVPRWNEIIERAGFEPGHFAVHNALASSPSLPEFQ